MAIIGHYNEDTDSLIRLHDFWEHVEEEDDEWPAITVEYSGYEYEDELVDQLAKLPSAEDVVELMSTLRVSSLREFSSEVVNGMVSFIIENRGRLQQARFINSWVATAEEIVAAGRNYNRVIARRR